MMRKRFVAKCTSPTPQGIGQERTDGPRRGDPAPERQRFVAAEYNRYPSVALAAIHRRAVGAARRFAAVLRTFVPRYAVQGSHTGALIPNVRAKPWAQNLIQANVSE